MCTEKLKSFFPAPFSPFPCSLQDGVDEMGDYGWLGMGARSAASSLQAASPAAAHRLAQPRESNTGESTRAFCQRSRCASPRRLRSSEICHFPPSKRNQASSLVWLN